MNQVKTIFIGSGDFAVPVLATLINIDFIDLNVIVTQPDKPVGRKQELEPTALGAYAADLGIEILKPAKIREVAAELLEKYQPELIIVASYGQIIPNSLLETPKYGCLNLHGSILPELRGAVPVPMAILKGFEETGVTLQKMAEKMDEGDIISIHKTTISEEETGDSLMHKLGELAAEHLEADLKGYVGGSITPVAQDHSKATYCYKEDLSKDKAEIKFDTDIQMAERMVRAFFPWPVAWVKLFDGKILKIYKARYDELLSKNVGDFLKLNTRGDYPFVMRSGKQLYLVLKTGVLDIEELQLEGKQKRGASEYFFLAEK